jgi:hypothetical protein
VKTYTNNNKKGSKTTMPPDLLHSQRHPSSFTKKKIKTKNKNKTKKDNEWTIQQNFLPLTPDHEDVKSKWKQGG